MAVTQLAKPQNTWCKHCEVGKGCKIYDDRPHECRDFDCGWLLSEALPDSFRPNNSHVIISLHDKVRLHVDPMYPNALKYGTGRKLADAFRQDRP
jgi:hypothetical protein